MQIKTPIQNPAHFTYIKTMHKQTSMMHWWGGYFIFLYLFFLWATRPPLGPFRAHWGPSGALWGLPTKTFFLSFLLGIDLKEAEALSLTCLPGQEIIFSEPELWS
jgi:hypothetical protein